MLSAEKYRRKYRAAVRDLWMTDIKSHECIEICNGKSEIL